MTRAPRRFDDAIKIGGLLDEPAWSLAQPATDFLQQELNKGLPASERTEVRVLFDDKNIYFGIRAFDSDAGHINARELVRDADFPMTILSRSCWTLSTIAAMLFVS